MHHRPRHWLHTSTHSHTLSKIILPGSLSPLPGKSETGVTGMCCAVSAHGPAAKRSCSCFNAFSRVDVRVDVRIPGGVHAYVIDLRGERHVYLYISEVKQKLRFTVRHTATPDIWQETYISALLRAIHYSDDSNYYLDAYRKLDPITTPEGELRFLQAAEALFDKGMCCIFLLLHPLSHLHRMAGGLGSRDPGSVHRLQPPYCRYYEVLRG